MAKGNSSASGLESRVRALAGEWGLTDMLLSTPLVAGVSGGADSLALLHLLVKLRGPAAASTLHVAHLNHRLRGDEANSDALFVQRVASGYGLTCTIEQADVPSYARNHKLSMEDAARRVRYAFLGRLAYARGAAVAVAHTADDQVETVLMNILRGTGISGLAGMEPLARMPISAEEDRAGSESSIHLSIFRPLLTLWREEIEAYCLENALEWRTDSTNSQLHYRRNRIRHRLLPALQSEYGSAVKARILDLAGIAAAEDAYLEEETRRKWDQVARVGDGLKAVWLRCADLGGTELALQRRLVRKALSHVAGTLEGFTLRSVDETLDLLKADGARSVHLPHGLAADKRGDALVIRHRSATADPPEVLVQYRIQWPTMGSRAMHTLEPANPTLVTLDDGWALHCEVTRASEVSSAPGDLVALFDLDELTPVMPVTLRTRRPGDFIAPLGMSGRKSLQDLMVDAKIPRAVRDTLPLAAHGHEIVWVPGPGGRRSGRALLTDSTERVLQLRFVREER